MECPDRIRVNCGVVVVVVLLLLLLLCTYH